MDPAALHRATFDFIHGEMRGIKAALVEAVAKKRGRVVVRRLEQQFRAVGRRWRREYAGFRERGEPPPGVTELFNNPPPQEPDAGQTPCAS
jgi:hypothetical protein